MQPQPPKWMEERNKPSRVIGGLVSNMSTVCLEVIAHNDLFVSDHGNTEKINTAGTAGNIPEEVADNIREIVQSASRPEKRISSKQAKDFQAAFNSLALLERAFYLVEHGQGLVTDEMMEAARNAVPFIQQFPQICEPAFEFLEQFRTDEERARENIGEYYNIELIQNAFSKLKEPAFLDALRKLPESLQALQSKDPRGMTKE